MFVLAGEPERAREWGQRAVDELLQRRGRTGYRKPPEFVRDDAGRAVDIFYLCTERERAMALAREHGLDRLSVDVIMAERDRDLERAESVIRRVSHEIVAERLEPTERTGEPLHLWDWLEAGFLVQSRIAGQNPPSHALMLERSGLLGPGVRRQVVWPARGGVDRFPVLGPDGAHIEATIDRRDPSAVEITLDPREADDRYLVLTFHWRQDNVYGISLWLEPLSSPQDVLPYQGPDFREAIDAAADRLDGTHFQGRDGTWAARTLREIAKDIQILED
jgi:hypothetical protein